MTRHTIDLTELEEFVIANDKQIDMEGYHISFKLQDEEDGFFTAHIKITQNDTKQDKHIKFRIGIEQHEGDKQGSSHDAEEPHFMMELVKRKEGHAARATFTLEVEDEIHLLECVKGTLVVLKEFLVITEQEYKLNKLTEKLLYSKAIEEELLPSKDALIDTLHQSYRNKQLVVRAGRETHTIKTPRQLQTHLDVPEAQPIYLPLLEKIQQ